MIYFKLVILQFSLINLTRENTITKPPCVIEKVNWVKN